MIVGGQKRLVLWRKAGVELRKSGSGASFYRRHQTVTFNISEGGKAGVVKRWWSAFVSRMVRDWVELG